VINYNVYPFSFIKDGLEFADKIFSLANGMIDLCGFESFIAIEKAINIARTRQKNWCRCPKTVKIYI